MNSKSNSLCKVSDQTHVYFKAIDSMFTIPWCMFLLTIEPCLGLVMNVLIEVLFLMSVDLTVALGKGSAR